MTQSVFLDLKKQIMEDVVAASKNYQELPDFLKNDIEITVACLIARPSLWLHTPPKLKKDMAFINILLEKEPWMFVYLDANLRKEAEFVVSVMAKTRGLAYFLCLEPAASSPQVKMAARSAGLVLNC